MILPAKTYRKFRKLSPAEEMAKRLRKEAKNKEQLLKTLDVEVCVLL
jgi:hypothetical protein